MMRFLLFIIMSIISTFGYIYLFCRINDIKCNFKNSIFTLILGIIVITLFRYNQIKYFTLLSFFIFYPILFYSLSGLSLKKLIINTLIIWLFAMIIDLLSMLCASFVSGVFNFNLDDYYNEFCIISSIILFLILFIVGYVNRTKYIFYKIIKFFYDIEYFDYALILFSIFVCVIAICIFGNLEKIKIDILLFVIIILSIFIFGLLIKFKINYVENKKYLQTLKENNDFYIKMDDENRIFKHNLMAKLSSIKSVSNKKAIALIDDFVTKNNRGISYSKKIKRIPYGLNGIIYQKTYPFLEEVNFKITNKIDFDIFKVLKPRRYNVLVEKLVVSLDNAIEASLNSKNKVVIINLYDDEDNIYIEIKNSFAHNLDIDNLGNLNYSTKGKRRGLGLFSILRDNEASLKVKVVNNYFISLISTKKQK